MSKLSVIIGALTLGVLFVTHVHAQTVDPMRTACADYDYAHGNDDVCIALAKTPFVISQQPTPTAYIHLPSEKEATPFYGSYDQCLAVAQQWDDRHSFMNKITDFDPHNYCIPAK